MQRLEIRIDGKKKAKFKKKADEEYGGMSRFLKLVIDAYTTGHGFATDEELTTMLYAVRALNSYTTNINQITKRMHQSGNKPSDYELKKLDELSKYSQEVVRVFRACIARNNEPILRLKE